MKTQESTAVLLHRTPNTVNGYNNFLKKKYMYVVTVTFEINVDHLDEFRKAMKDQAANSLKLETGCHQFDVCFSPENPQLCFLYEKYDNRAAFDLHLGSEHFRNFDQIVKPWITAKDVGTWINAD